MLGEELISGEAVSTNGDRLKSFLGKLVKLSKKKTVFKIVFNVDPNPVQI